MIITGANFARIADGIYSFHIEKIKNQVVITFTDATGGEVFRIEKSVKSKDFRVDLLKEALITELLLPNVDGERHKYDVLDIDEIIRRIDEDPGAVEEEMKKESEANQELFEFYETLFSVVASEDEEVNRKSVKEIKEVTRKYLESGEAPEWFKKVVEGGGE